MNNMSRPKIIITIDTEVGEKAKFVKDGFEKFIMGKIGDDYYGIPKIIEILNAHHVKGEFFVDVYEKVYFGEKKYATLCKYLDEQGHGVQLHTHPGYSYDINRIYMHEYSLEEQKKIIKDGKELIKKWIGKFPIAHRAGSYGANNDTLDALMVNDIKIDSSYFYKHKNCKIQLPTVNDAVLSNFGIELPVTVVKEPTTLHSIPFPFKTEYKKLDINWLTYEQLSKSISKLPCKYKILFLHSSSFLVRDSSNHDIKEVDKRSLKRFKFILKYLSEKKYDVINFEELLIKLKVHLNK